jgi:hypothetical protein
MLDNLKPIVEQIDTMQKHCEDLTNFIGKMLGEQTSCEAIAVHKNAFEEEKPKKKKKKLVKEEGENKNEFSSEKAKNLQKKAIEIEAKEKIKNLETETNGDNIIEAEEDEPVESDLDKELNPYDIDTDEEPEDEIEDEPISDEEPEDEGDDEGNVNIIRRTLSAMENTPELQEWVDRYFSLKLKGNTGEAEVMREKIDRKIDIMNLNREFVYHGKTKSQIENKDSEEGNE